MSTAADAEDTLAGAIGFQRRSVKLRITEGSAGFAMFGASYAVYW